MWTEELALKILDELFEKDLNSRIIALDFETKVLSKNEFLTNEMILGVSLARRNKDGKIDYPYYILDNENLDAELSLLEKMDVILGNWNPLVIVGYGFRTYDIPLLAIKSQRCRNNGQNFWKISNALNGAIHIELSDLVRYLLEQKLGESRKYLKMIEILKHPSFSDLPFIKTKELIDSSKEKKGVEIYESWKNKDSKFSLYLETESYNLILITERIMEIYKKD